MTLPTQGDEVAVNRNISGFRQGAIITVLMLSLQCKAVYENHRVTGGTGKPP